ncbi:dienelactone hydrolase family protein [Pseudoxanthomonas indica]|uniref:Carboxymethylenebutenolidase n=1 Tax=Pseudoxanthomonas indica TaxID=428993 RepID=A0A1T5J114_9GAMM|nr:dienelactone hydrolase family protein [Pseudoxanthomonas indica]GGD55442.1 carboxymethylenebutenolidase [Pseudoxanthomonas indica]SKC44908.1 carboxymethylenebutenolidase [Pseudoxanthomonas indica]
MGQWIDLHTARGSVQAWQALPEGAPRGGLVVVQEIFGVNPHIRSVADRYAEAGYAVLAPAFFDLLEPGTELPYDKSAHDRGRELVNTIGLDAALDVVSTAALELASAGKVGVVGYCWGGSVAFLSALKLGLPSVSYYGARNKPFLEAMPAGSAPLAPVIFHFGDHDTSIPPEVVQLHRDKLPDAPVYTYPSGHAFNRDVSPDIYDAESAKLALSRSLEFFAEQLR